MFEYSDSTLAKIYALVKAGMLRHSVDDDALEWYACVCRVFGVSPGDKLGKDTLPSAQRVRYRRMHQLMIEQVMPILPVTFADALFQDCLCGTPLVGYQACSTFYLRGKLCRHGDILVRLLDLCKIHSVITPEIAGMTRDQLDDMIDQLEGSGMLLIVAKNPKIGGYATRITERGISLIAVHARLVAS